MSSKLASAPDRVNAVLATSKIRSRLRWASVRGFRSERLEGFLGIKENVTGECLRISNHSETLSVLPKSWRFVNSDSGRQLSNLRRNSICECSSQGLQVL